MFKIGDKVTDSILDRTGTVINTFGVWVMVKFGSEVESVRAGWLDKADTLDNGRISK